MKDFLDQSYRLRARGQHAGELGAFDNVFSSLAALTTVHSKSELDLDNVEAVFAACEMAKTLGKFPGKSPEEIQQVITDLKRVIVITLEQTLRFQKSPQGTPLPPDPYSQFVQLLNRLRTKLVPRHEIAILTFNYDLALDYALIASGGWVDYALGPPQDTSRYIPLLKLHGSLHWSQRSDNKEVVAADLRYFFNNLPVSESDMGRPDIAIRIGSLLKTPQYFEGINVTGEPVIVPPTWNKGELQNQLTRVWSRAAQELSTAENIIVIGFSMPPTDSFFHYLYALGTEGSVPIKKFWVFNPSTDPAIRERFECLMGPAARARFFYFPKSFQPAIGVLERAFGADTNFASELDGAELVER